MSSSGRRHYDHRRRKKQGQQRSLASQVGTVVATAAVAYGTYKAIDYYWNRRDDDDDDHSDDSSSSSATSSASPQQKANLLSPSSLTSALFGLATPSPRKTSHRRRKPKQIKLCTTETRKAFSRLVVCLQDPIDAATATNPITKELKQLRGNKTTEALQKQESLWNDLQLQAVTRLLTTAYAHTILYIVLSVQIQLLSVQKASARSSGEEPPDSPSAFAPLLLQTYEYFLKDGIPRLARAVKEVSQKELTDFQVMEASTCHKTEQQWTNKLQAIHSAFVDSHNPSGAADEPLLLWRYLLPPENESNAQDDDSDEMHHLQDSLLDVLESPIYVDAQHDCWSAVFGVLQEVTHEQYFAAVKTLPLAKLVAHCKQLCTTFYPTISRSMEDEDETIMTDYQRALESIPSLLELQTVSTL